MSRIVKGLVVTRAEATAVTAAGAVFDAAGVEWTLKRGGKHLQIRCRGHHIPVSCTPGVDDASVANRKRQDARRLLRKLEAAFEE